MRRSSNYKVQYACSHWTWRLDPPPFKKNNINPWDWGAPFHFCGFSKTKLVRKLSSTCLHALPTKTFHKFYITSIFCSKTCFSLQAWFFFHHTLYTLNIPITCSHNMVMAHTPAQISIYLWLNMEAYSEQRLFLFCTIHVQYRVPFQKKNFSFIRDGYVQFTSLKDKNCPQKYFYESKVYSSFHHSYQIS